MSTKDMGIAQSTKYQPPTTGLISYLPASWALYAELMRLDRPVGFYALYVPCLFGVFYATITSPAQASPVLIIYWIITLLLCCLLARGAACTWNDAVDSDFDKVARCKSRPIARGGGTRSQAHMWAIIQTLATVAILFRLPFACMRHFSGIVVLSKIYRFAKRFTHYPQFVLGSIFSVAVFEIRSILECRFIIERDPSPFLVFPCGQYCSDNFYDKIHARQDVADDVHAGVKSIAVKFQSSTKLVTSLLARVLTALLAMTDVMVTLSAMYTRKPKLPRANCTPKRLRQTVLRTETIGLIR